MVKNDLVTITPSRPRETATDQIIQDKKFIKNQEQDEIGIEMTGPHDGDNNLINA